MYTTRPDTLFGATYMVVAPEHPLLSQLAASSQVAEVAAYIEAAAKKSDFERTELSKHKSGVFTGGRAPLEGGWKARSCCLASAVTEHSLHTNLLAWPDGAQCCTVCKLRSSSAKVGIKMKLVVGGCNFWLVFT